MFKSLKFLFLALLSFCSLAATQNALAEESGLVCKYTYNFRDTFKVTRQDRPVTVTKTDKMFGFSWGAYENYSDASWEFTVNLEQSELVRVRLRNVNYDDNMYIYVNGQQIFGRVGGGINGFDANLDVGKYFKDGENTIRVRLINDIPNYAKIGATFDYSEGGCTATDLPRPPIPPLPDSQRCVESLVCTQPVDTRSFSGINVKRSCWQWKTTRTCYDFIEDTSTCQVPTPPKAVRVKLFLNNV